MPGDVPPATVVPFPTRPLDSHDVSELLERFRLCETESDELLARSREADDRLVICVGAIADAIGCDETARHIGWVPEGVADAYETDRTAAPEAHRRARFHSAVASLQRSPRPSGEG